MACTFSYTFDMCPERKTANFVTETDERYLITHELTWTIYGNSILNMTVESNVAKNALITAELCSGDLAPLKRNSVLENNRATLNFHNINLLTPDPWRCIIHVIPHLQLQEIKDSSTSSATSNHGLTQLRKGPFTKSKLEQLSADLLQLFTSGDLSDVILSDGTNEIGAHKMVLAARSPVFARMFQNPMKENSENRVVIPDVPEEVLKQLLYFIYSGRVTLKDEGMARNLYIAADKYAVIDLKNACSDVLRNVSYDNVLETLSLAGLYEDKNLKRSCFLFISDNYAQVKNSKAWEIFLKENPQLAVEILSFILEKNS